MPEVTLIRSTSLQDGVYKYDEVIIGHKDNEGVLISSVRMKCQRRDRCETMPSRAVFAVSKVPSDSSAQSENSMVPNVTQASVSTVAAGQLNKQEAILKRANGDVMPLYLQKLAQTTVIRNRDAILEEQEQDSMDDGSVAAHINARKEIGQNANKFDSIYARVRNILEEKISFRPLQRSHSICLGESEFCHKARRTR